MKLNFAVGVDGLSLPLVLLTAFLGLVSTLISWSIELRPKEYFAWLLVLETSLLGVFTSLDFVLFFLFWEVELIPMYFLISIWGSGNRVYSAWKYVLYTFFGSAFMLVGILTLGFTAGTFDIRELAADRPDRGRDHPGLGDLRADHHGVSHEAAGGAGAYVAAGRAHGRADRRVA